jgi:hypothetical protein
MNRWLTPCLMVLLAACTRSPPPAVPANPAPPAKAPASTPAPSVSTRASTDAGARFVDKVWRVESSTAVAPGTLYTFRSDGTLIISAAQQPSGYGHWTYRQGALVMIEEGIAYPTDILALDDDRFSIRSHNPGKPVDIVLVRATDVALPEPAAK